MFELLKTLARVGRRVDRKDRTERSGFVGGRSDVSLVISEIVTSGVHSARRLIDREPRSVEGVNGITRSESLPVRTHGLDGTSPGATPVRRVSDVVLTMNRQTEGTRSPGGREGDSDPARIQGAIWARGRDGVSTSLRIGDMVRWHLNAVPTHTTIE